MLSRLWILPLALVVACTSGDDPKDTDDPVTDGDDTDVETDVDTDGVDTAEDTDDTDDTDLPPDGFPNPITYLDDPTGGSWSDAFALPGVIAGSAARVTAIDTLPTGDLVVGGIFDFITRDPVQNIAVRDATTGAWSALGGGVDFYVEDMVVDGDDLWVVGWSESDMGLLGQVARWDGSVWHRTLSDLDGRVYGVAVVGEELVITGEFGTVDGEPTDGIGWFDGDTWFGDAAVWADEGYGSLRRSFVRASDDALCVTGNVSPDGVVMPVGILCLDDEDGWVPWGDLPGEVYGVAALNDGTLMAWGGFALDLDGDFNFVIGLATWDGSAWVEPDEGGVDGGLTITVRDLLPQGDHGYVVTGQFSAVGAGTSSAAVPAGYIGAYDGAAWNNVGGGLGTLFGVFAANVEGGYALYDDGDDTLWVGGMIHEAAGSTSLGLAAWDGSVWERPFDATDTYGIPGSGEDVAVGIDGTVWLVATQQRTGGPTLLTWSGSGFEPAPPWAPQGAPVDLDLVDGVVHAVGDLAVGVRVCDIAAHVAPQRWRCLVRGLDGLGSVIGHDAAGSVYVAGSFETATLKRIAKWDGSTLLPLGAGLTDGSVSLMAVSPDGDVVVSGFGLKSGATELGDLALWDGTTWSAITGMSGFPYGLAWYDGDLIVAGGFFSYDGGPNDGDPIGALLRWDGSTWSDFGTFSSSGGGSASTWYVQSWADGLFVMGDFDAQDGAPVERLVWFDGSSWTSLGVGPDDLISDLAVGASEVWIAGPFLKVGGAPSFAVGRWDLTP